MVTNHDPYIIQFDCQKELNVVICEFRDEFAPILRRWEGNEGESEHYHFYFKSNDAYAKGKVGYPYSLFFVAKEEVANNDANPFVHSVLLFFDERDYRHKMMRVYDTYNLMNKASLALNNKRYDELFSLLDETIQYYTENDIPSFFVRLFKENIKGLIYGVTHDNSADILKEAIEYSKQQDKRFQQIDYLVQLAGMVSYRQQQHALALTYLDECDGILDSFTAEYIRQFVAPKGPYRTEQEFIDLIEAGRKRVKKEREQILSRME